MAEADVTRFFHPVLPAAALGRHKPVLVQVAGRRFALFRDAAGRPAALDDACPHRKAPLSIGRVSAGRLTCAYHGWSFDACGGGRSPSQPGLRSCDTASYQVVERWRHLWLAGRSTPLERFPAIGWEGFEFAGSFHTLFPAPLHVALDNFSEDEHFPTVHSFLGWDAAGLPEVGFRADNFDDRTEVHYKGPQRRHLLLPLLGVKAGDRFFNDWVTRFDPVHAVFNFHWEDQRTGERRPLVLRTGVFMVPETPETTRFHVFIFVGLPAGSVLRLLTPVLRPAALLLGRREVAADARFTAHLAHIPLSLEGMRLGKYDKPVIHNRKLLQRIYWAGAENTEAR